MARHIRKPSCQAVIESGRKMISHYEQMLVLLSALASQEDAKAES